MRNVAALPAVLLLSLVGGTPAAASTWTVPGTVNASGLNNTRFVSDLAVTNPGTASTVATISFVPASGTTPRQVTLAPGQTVVYRNALDTLFAVQGAGATQVQSDAPLLIRARTYNTAATGTYGVALPVFADERLLAGGSTADSLWVSQSADGSSGYRTNIAVVFPDATGGEARVTVFDAEGNAAGSQYFSLTEAGFQQFGVGSIAGPVAVARAEIQIVRGPAAGYAVVVDNVTGDSSLFTFEELPAGWQDVLSNGVARANGRNGTFFRTDARFFNPDSADAAVTVAFHASQDANPHPVTATFTVPAGKILEVVDVLSSLLGLPVGSAGALRFTSQDPVAISCRTSNVDPSGEKPGTFGAQQKPSQLLSFLMSADPGAVVTGIRQNGPFRTNVGFAAGPDGAAYALTLRSAPGAVVATATASLGVFGWTQPSVQDLFPGTPIPDDATLEVKVTAGSVDVFDSSIDNTSGDPVLTPIMRLPADIPSAATIGPSGGSIRSSDGVFTLKVPAGALSSPTPMSIALAPNQAPDPIGSGYAISPAGLSFAKPALLSLRYGTRDLPVDAIAGAAVVLLTPAGLAALGGGKLDTSSRSLVLPIQTTSPSVTAAAKPLAARPAPAADGATFGLGSALGVKLSNRLPYVPTGGKMDLTAVFRTAPSSTSEPFDISLEVGAAGAEVTWDAPKLGTFSSTSGATIHYTAPASILDVTAAVSSKVRVKNTVTNSDGTKTTSKYQTAFSFNVIRRNFLFSEIYSMHLPCGNGNRDVSVTLSSPANVFSYFRFDDDLSVHAGPAFSLGLPVTPTLASCKDCKVSVSEMSGPLELRGLLGTFVGAPGFFLAGTTFQRNAVPAYTESGDPIACNGSDGTDLIIPAILPPRRGDPFWPLSSSSQKAVTAVQIGTQVINFEFEWGPANPPSGM